MKVFYISFPFDDENSGDYDYCKISAEALKGVGINAEYITGGNVKGYSSERAKSLLNIIKAKNKGGQDFYQSLQKFYEDNNRTELAKLVKDHLIQNKAAQNILNLQIRAPETGFLFSHQDLVDLKNAGFKICVTCHEYKLNYERRWLQTALHDYFKEADLIFFFSAKDLKNASKHADHSAFLDQLSITPDTNIQKLSHKLLTKPFTISTKPSTSEIHYFNAFFKNVTIKQSLECELFTGKLAMALPKEEIPLNGRSNSKYGLNFSSYV